MHLTQYIYIYAFILKGSGAPRTTLRTLLPGPNIDPPAARERGVPPIPINFRIDRQSNSEIPKTDNRSTTKFPDRLKIDQFPDRQTIEARPNSE